ncbi:MAG: hypothetical protein SGI77_17130 [Pirellulaceae bacterium]|nr:hypothetical protein [Pirellulaceae bacterium]
MATKNDFDLSPLAVRMQQDLQLNGKGERTQESYLRAVRKFAEFFGNSPLWTEVFLLENLSTRGYVNY